MGKKKHADRSRKAAQAVQAEAAAEGVVFTYRGKEFTTLPVDEMSIDILEATEEGNALKSIRLMLGESAWQRFRAMKPTLGDLAEFSEALAEAMGLDGQGN